MSRRVACVSQGNARVQFLDEVRGRPRRAVARRAESGHVLPFHNRETLKAAKTSCCVRNRFNIAEAIVIA